MAKIQFRLRYVTHDFGFGDSVICASDSKAGISVTIRKREKEEGGVPLQPGDGIAEATREMELSEDVIKSICTSPTITKEPLSSLYKQMSEFSSRTLRLARWRTNAPGGPQTWRYGMNDGFSFSMDGATWSSISQVVSFTITHQVIPNWTAGSSTFVNDHAGSDLDEPLAHELLREAWANREINRRSALILAVAAAEVGFKQFVMMKLPDTAWLLERYSPPLAVMLKKFPWGKIGKINGGDLIIPRILVSAIAEAAERRNATIHRGETLTREDTLSNLTAVKDLLYFLDACDGQQWALQYISGPIVAELGQNKV
jgi:hypothetical protein